MKNIYTFILAIFSLSINAQENVKINEFMASNTSTVADETGSFEDWIEIYNPNSFEVNIAGYYISDALDNIQKYKIPETSEEAKIPANGFLIIWADSKSHLGHLHTNFKLSASGDVLVLTAVDGTTIVDQYTFGVQTTDISEGRKTDGATTWKFFNTPTPGASNNTIVEPEPNTNKLIYYWHFNNLNTSTGDVKEVSADFNAISSANPKMTYTGSNSSGRDMDEFSTGSSLNLNLSELAGKGIRVRNESESRSLIFDLPTNGHEDIVFEYSVQRSGQGMLKNIIHYTIDGINYTQNNLASNTFNMLENYTLIKIDFSNISEVKNNPNFKIRITFEGNTSIADGNNRFDNITLKGNEIGLTINEIKNSIFNIFPNPFQNEINVTGLNNFDVIKIIDIKSKVVFESKFENTKNKSLDLIDLDSGVYFIEINSNKQKLLQKLIKE
jgi:hypothetical protein